MLTGYTFWFVVGSQHLYGPEVLSEVAAHARTMAEEWNADTNIPCGIVFKGVGTNPEEIKKVCMEANGDRDCAGVIVWMHTFSPSKMWIGGLSLLNKPYLHINTQFNRDLPFDTIDMDFMNTNQSAHGDREHGFITARLRMKRKIICGYWGDEVFRSRMGGWMRSAVGAMASRDLKVMRLGDNMRYVAVTEGDKIQAEKDLGWSVNTYGVGGFTQKVAAVSNAQIDCKMEEYRAKYALRTDNLDAVRYQARIEIALQQMLEEGGFGAFTDTFEDLCGLEQLPGLAVQNLMAGGYGFGAEGDWKTAALGAVMGAMSADLGKRLSFIEDYTYHFEAGNEAVLGAHMLEVSPCIANEKAAIEVHPLGIGGKADPARLVFEGAAGKAILVTVVDMGGRFRMIAHDVQAMPPMKKMPKLPVASVLWRPAPDMITGNEAWIRCGGTHHSVLSYDLAAEHMADFADIMGIEFVHIGQSATIDDLKMKLVLGDLIWGK